MHSFLIFCAKYMFLLVGLGWLVVLVRLPRERRWRYIAVTILAGVLALVLSQLAAHLHYEPRPFVVRHVRPWIAHGTDNGFPSDHALLTMTLTAVAYFYAWRLATATLVGTVLVGIGRVAALLHSPQQIAAGWVLGAVSAVVAYWVVKWSAARFAARRK